MLRAVIDSNAVDRLPEHLEAVQEAIKTAGLESACSVIDGGDHAGLTVPRGTSLDAVFRDVSPGARLGS